MTVPGAASVWATVVVEVTDPETTPKRVLVMKDWGCSTITVPSSVPVGVMVVVPPLAPVTN